MATLLVVDDDPKSLALSCLVLTAAGYDVIQAVDGQSALAAAQAMLPDLVLLDIVMPRMNGFHVLRLLRNLPGAAELPVVAFSAFPPSVNDEHERGIGDRFTAWLTRPIPSTHLIDAVRACLEREAPRAGE